MALPTDLGEALERAGDLSGAETALREAQRQQPSTDAALGLLRVGSAQAEPGPGHRGGAGIGRAGRRSDEPPCCGRTRPCGPAVGKPADHSAGLVTGQQEAGTVRTRRRRAALASGCWVATRSPRRPGCSRSRARGRGARRRRRRERFRRRGTGSGFWRARRRVGGWGARRGGAVHDQVDAISGEAAPITVGLSDLPVAGRPERIAARIARAARSDPDLAYALDVERALATPNRGPRGGMRSRLSRRALRRAPEGVEALEGIKRLATATGDRVGAARAGCDWDGAPRSGRGRRGAGHGGSDWEDLAMPDRRGSHTWHSLAARAQSLSGCTAPTPQSSAASTTRRASIVCTASARGDRGDAGRRSRLLLERAGHRLKQLNDSSDGAIEDSSGS